MCNRPMSAISSEMELDGIRNKYHTGTRGPAF